MKQWPIYVVVNCVLWYSVSVSAETVPSKGNVAKPVASTQEKFVNTPSTVQPKYVVQLGAFVDEIQAVRWRQQLAEAGVKTFIVPAKDPHGMMRIQAGPYASKKEAQAMVLLLELHGVENAIVLPEASRS